MWLTVPVTLSGYCSHFPGIREQQGSVRAAGLPQRLEKLERGEVLKMFLDWKRADSVLSTCPLFSHGWSCLCPQYSAVPCVVPELHSQLSGRRKSMQ